MKPIITVTALGKKYRIRHNGGARYKTFREALSGLPRIFSRPKDGRGRKEDFWALRDVSFDVAEGDRIGIIGRNGAGKSTLLKLLSRITSPTEGKITLRGRVASLLEVGTGFHPELTGRENIFLNGAILGMRRTEIQRRFDEIVDFAGVARFLDTPVKRYSSGMYVRLAFAVAAYLEPDILVVDEVLAVGDGEFQKKCLGKMGELSQSGRTILFVTHNLDAMLALCNRGVLLEKGGVVIDSSAAETHKLYLKRMAETEYSVDTPSSRGGSGGVVIERVWAETQAGKAFGYISSGVSLKLFLIADVSEMYRSREGIEVSFAIDTLEGHRVYTTISSWSDFAVDVASGRIQVVCSFDTVPFVPGQYLVSGTVIFRGDTLDCVVHCSSFEVLPRQKNAHIEWLSEWGRLDLPCRFENIKNPAPPNM